MSVYEECAQLQAELRSVHESMWRGKLLRQLHWGAKETPPWTSLSTPKSWVVWNDSAVVTHLKESGHKFDDRNVSILDKDPKWFEVEREVREAVHVNTENPSPSRGGGLRHDLSLLYNPVIRKIPRRLNNEGINTADSPNPGEFPPDRAEEAT